MDCSVTKRKGCNYCLRGKEFHDSSMLSVSINDDDCKGNAELIFRINDKDSVDILNRVKINYCPICGKDLKIKR